ncbi:hypothetical protein T552_02141 [Pneumocystis carinii B80]|uniref:Tetrapyrrole biosynthesis uroporphyrinogen III synthase domain-containing protein n=1 Tax=Pneumocystis carinii (strain B80) TaxID=1408658 RepID=A0A0W4ZH61_PNEC8|nr:hypothetical protein T552_02141 [Pneumocystis carinii B80]KTW27701.1 hypothetical protein T552_02141 [Pneumocystis carinii B80]
MKTVLFLRKRASSEDNYEKLFKNKGFNTLFIPILTCSYINQKCLRNILEKSPYIMYSGLIFTSRNAIVSFKESLIGIDKQEYEKISNMRVYTVGSACYKELISLGFSNIYGKESGNAENLSKFIISYHKKEEPILFITGERRIGILEKKLPLSGINLKEIVVYKMEERIEFEKEFNKVIYDEELNLEWIVFFSPYGSDIVMKYVKNEDLLKFKIATIGSTTWRHLNDKWNIKTSVVSEYPEAGSLLEGILDYEKEKNEY